MIVLKQNISNIAQNTDVLLVELGLISSPAGRAEHDTNKTNMTALAQSIINFPLILSLSLVVRCLPFYLIPAALRFIVSIIITIAIITKSFHTRTQTYKETQCRQRESTKYHVQKKR